MFSHHSLTVLTLAAILVSACASMVHGSRQSIEVQSDPPGAQVSVDRDPVPYTTPTTISFTRGEAHVLVFRKDGFEDYSAQLTSSTSGAVLGNVLLGGVVGIATDYTSGAAYELGHANLINNVLTVRLAPKTATGNATSFGKPTAAEPGSPQQSRP